MLKRILFIALLLTGLGVQAQELNCTVTVLTPRIQSSDKKIFTTLQTSLFEFMNNTKWTQDKFSNDEKIECSMQIEVTDRVSTDQFKGTIQVTARRPVFGTSYNSPLLNFKDEKFDFRYVEFQTLEFNESGNNMNLVSMMAYYAYVILGLDYDSFGKLSGSPYFAKAQAIVANNSNSADEGWKAFEGTRNRYWLVENLNNPIYKPIRNLYYDFHRKGLDIMTKQKDDALRNIATSITALKKVNDDKPGSLLMKTMFDAKSEEIVNIFSGATPDIKTDVVQVLTEIDPTNTGRYEKILNAQN